MRGSFPILLPFFFSAALVGANAAAHTVTPVAAAADVTVVARPVRARWERRPQRPIRVFIAAARTTRGWQPELIESAWAGFRRWSTPGVPVRFARVWSPTDADVVVEWVESLPGTCIGKTWREDI